ncbi:ubiquitin carboxyl-terminal hydrolase 37 [Aplochiton taeniatus]
MPKLSGGSTVSIRVNSLELGTTRFKEGSFEIIEKDNKVYLLLRFNSGGATKKVQLTQNVKTVTLSKCRIMVTLKDSSVVTIDQLPPTLAQKTKEYLENLKKEKPSVLKTSCGSGSFSMLGNRPLKIETSPRGEYQINTGRSSLEAREETALRKPLTSPIRADATPVRNGLSEISENRKRLLTSNSGLSDDYSKENDSSSNNMDPSRKCVLNNKEKLKQVEETRNSAPLQPTSFYGSRSVTKDYGNCQSFVNRPATNQTPSAKRSLVLPHHSIPFKKVRPSVDYSGWNKQRTLSNAQTQAPLQGFSNLGNTCYMNAILQSLFSLPSFSNDLLKQGIPWKKVPGNALLRRFAHLLAKKDVSCHETKKDLLRRVKNAISSTAERFSGYMQNDAHEFLSQCLDQLKEDVEKVNKCWSSDLVASAPVSVWEEPQPTGEAVRPGGDVDSTCIYTCPVMVNMEFEVQHTIKCKGCGEMVSKREQFNDLSIDLPRKKKDSTLRSIQDSLDLFFRMEEIEYSCDKCSAKTATVKHTFSRLPRVLILHLKRYSFNAQLSLNSKLGQQVVIPRYLTLVSHCTDTTQPPLRLGWNAHGALRGSMMPGRSATIVLGSDTEGEQSKKERGISVEPAEINKINDDEMLAAVIQMSHNEHDPTLEDEPTSSPDTGFGDSNLQDLFYHPELQDTESKRPEVALDSLDLTMDENKENQTPEGVKGELDWAQQYSHDQEREEQEFQQALAKSLQEHEAQEMREDDDLKKATELSLQECNNSISELLCCDEDSGSEDMPNMEHSETVAEDFKRNAEHGELANSFRLISVVSHIGSNSSSGHYVSDVYDMKKQSWLTYNDLDVTRTQESSVQSDRDRSGYIFFYMHKNVFEELSEMEKMGISSSLEPGRNVLQPL